MARAVDGPTGSDFSTSDPVTDALTVLLAALHDVRGADGGLSGFAVGCRAAAVDPVNHEAPQLRPVWFALAELAEQMDTPEFVEETTSTPRPGNPADARPRPEPSRSGRGARRRKLRRNQT